MGKWIFQKELNQVISLTQTTFAGRFLFVLAEGNLFYNIIQVKPVIKATEKWPEKAFKSEINHSV